MKAVILAGGLGMRLRPLTEVIPKPLLPLGEKAILEVQIERLKKAGFDDIYIATNYKADYIAKFLGDGSRYGVKVTTSFEEEPLGTAGPLKLLEKQLDEPFLVMNGDILTLLDLRKFFDFGCEKDCPMAITIKKDITPYEFGNIEFEGDFVSGIREKPDIVMYILAGIYFMKPEILDNIPRSAYYGMDQLITKLLKGKVPITKYEIRDYWLDIGEMDDFNEVQTSYESALKHQLG